MSSILLDITTDDEGARLLARLQLNDERVRVLEQGANSRTFEVVINDAGIAAGSGEGWTELRSLLDGLDPSWRDHVILPISDEGAVG